MCRGQYQVSRSCVNAHYEAACIRAPCDEDVAACSAPNFWAWSSCFIAVEGLLVPDEFSFVREGIGSGLTDEVMWDPSAT